MAEGQASRESKKRRSNDTTIHTPKSNDQGRLPERGRRIRRWSSGDEGKPMPFADPTL